MPLFLAYTVREKKNSIFPGSGRKRQTVNCLFPGETARKRKNSGVDFLSVSWRFFVLFLREKYHRDLGTENLIDAKRGETQTVIIFWK